MQINVQHKLQLTDAEDVSNIDDTAFVLPVREAQAVMGETVAAYLARVAWRFDLPTICIINGECYSRTEWEERALTLNDNIAFVSRPMGSGSRGSTAKSLVSIVALVALTAIAGPAGFVGSALATALGPTVGALASAAIVGASALAIDQWTRAR